MCVRPSRAVNYNKIQHLFLEEPSQQYRESELAKVKCVFSTTHSKGKMCCSDYGKATSSNCLSHLYGQSKTENINYMKKGKE